MRLHASSATLVAVSIFPLLLNGLLALANENGYQVESAVLTVYRDGLVHVAETLVVNETFPSVTLPLLASSVENILVIDENKTMLDYEKDGFNVTVYSLGAKSIEIEYDTASLTAKEAGLWNLFLDTPLNLTVYLPEESTIMYLSDVPTSIDTEGSRIRLSLFPDHWEISYELPLLPPADFRVSDLRVTPAQVEAGEKVTISVKVTNIGGEAGAYTVDLNINQATEASKTVLLAGGGSTILEFTVTREDAGTYNIETAGLTGQFTVREAPLPRFPMEYVAAAMIVGAGVILAAFVLLRGKPPTAGKILKAHPYLRKEDSCVIQFLEEKGGRAFESEIRQRFPDMPRTSLWRLVKRLEKLDIVKVRRIGLENQVELKK